MILIMHINNTMNIYVISITIINNYNNVHNIGLNDNRKTNNNDYNINDKRIWIAIEQEAMNNLHHYNTIDLSKLYFASYISSPKYISIDFRRVIFDKINNELSNLTLEELFSVCVGLRMSKEKNIYNTEEEQLIV